MPTHDLANTDLRRHRPLTRLLHWCTFILVVIAAGAIITHGYVGGSAERKLLLHLHQGAGVAVLGLTLLRLTWRPFTRTGVLHANMPAPMRIGAATTHAALYITLLALTLLGWLTTNAAGQKLGLFGIELPTLIGRNRDLGDELQEWHADLAWLLCALVITHVAAALWHHYRRRDGVLRSIWLYDHSQ